MAIAATAVFEVNVSVGSDTNAGAYNGSRSGASTDYTYGASRVVFTYTDLASTNGNTSTPTITSVSRSFVAADIGNHIRISAGTSWTVGLYEIVSVSGGAATLDRAVGTAATLSSGSGKVGGPLASPGLAGAGVVVGGNTVWIKAGNYPITSLTANVSGGVFNAPTATNANSPTVVYGYNTTRGDAPVQGSRPNLYPDSSAGTWVNAILNGARYMRLAYVDFSNPQALSANGVSMAVANCEVLDCSFDGFSTSGKQGVSIVGTLRRCRVTNCNLGLRPSGSSEIVECYTRGCVTSVRMAGATTQLHVTITRCIFDGGICEITGGVSGGTDDSLSYIYCTLANGAYWLLTSSTIAPAAVIKRCVQYGGATYGIDSTMATNIPWLLVEDTAMGGNSSGNINPSIPASQYSNIIALSGNPFVDAANATVASRNYALNTTAGAGSAARAIAYSYPGTLTISYSDLGAVQSRPVAISPLAAPILGGQNTMPVKPGDSITWRFSTISYFGGLIDADSLPAASLVRNGTADNAVAMTVTRISTGQYSAAWTVPGTYAAGDILQLLVTAVVGGVTDTRPIWAASLDARRIADISDANGAVTLTAATISAIWANATRTLTAAVNTPADIATAVWANGTRSLTTFGTLVSDIWANATRTLSAFGFGVTVTTNNDKSGYSLTTTPPTAIQIRQEMDSNSTKLANLDATISGVAAAVWSSGTRSLTTFGTLVSDIATAVWAAGSRTLTAFGFAVATTSDATITQIADQLNDVYITAGSVQVTIHVQDSSGTALVGAIVSIKGRGRRVTDASGNAVASLDPGSYTIKVDAEGLIIPDTAATVTAPGPQTITIAASAAALPDAPTNPGQCRVYIQAANATGQEKVFMWQINLPQVVSSGQVLKHKQQATWDGTNKRFVFPDTVPYGTYVHVICSDGSIDNDYPVPSSAYLAILQPQS